MRINILEFKINLKITVKILKKIDKNYNKNYNKNHIKLFKTQGLGDLQYLNKTIIYIIYQTNYSSN